MSVTTTAAIRWDAGHRERSQQPHQGSTDADSRQVGKDEEAVGGAQHKVAELLQPVHQTEPLHPMGHRLLRVSAARENPLAGHPAWAQAASHMMRPSSNMFCKGSEMACQAACPASSSSSCGAPGLSTAESAVLRQEPAMQSLPREGV